jgi:hypothetical protein
MTCARDRSRTAETRQWLGSREPGPRFSGCVHLLRGLASIVLFDVETFLRSGNQVRVMVLLTLPSHGGHWRALPFKTPDATLPQILDKVGSKADETGAPSVSN